MGSQQTRSLLGPRTFCLPYHLGELTYEQQHKEGLLQGDVWAGREQHDHNTSHLRYRAKIDPGTTYKPCKPDTLDAFLLERYTAYTLRFGKLCYFRIWHPP